jgi:glutamine synthetase
MMETYNKTVNIEALTMLDMTMKDILPSISKYCSTLSDTIISRKQVCENIPCLFESETLKKLSETSEKIFNLYNNLQAESESIPTKASSLEIGKHMRQRIIPLMSDLRDAVDTAQLYTAADYWPYPVYTDLIYKI